MIIQLFRFGTWQACRDACSLNPSCFSFDYHENVSVLTEADWGGWCYERVVSDFPFFAAKGRVAGRKLGVPTPPPSPPVVPTPQPSPGCNSDDDCSRNGVCSTAVRPGVCECDPEWYGAQCELLFVLPTPRDNGPWAICSSLCSLPCVISMLCVLAML